MGPWRPSEPPEPEPDFEPEEIKLFDAEAASKVRIIESIGKSTQSCESIQGCFGSPPQREGHAKARNSICQFTPECPERESGEAKDTGMFCLPSKHPSPNKQVAKLDKCKSLEYQCWKVT